MLIQGRRLQTATGEAECGDGTGRQPADRPDSPEASAAAEQIDQHSADKTDKGNQDHGQPDLAGAQRRQDHRHHLNAKFSAQLCARLDNFRNVALAASNHLRRRDGLHLQQSNGALFSDLYPDLCASLTSDPWYECQGQPPVLLLNLRNLAERKAEVFVQGCLREYRQDNQTDHQELQGCLQLEALDVAGKGAKRHSLRLHRQSHDSDGNSSGNRTLNGKRPEDEGQHGRDLGGDAGITTEVTQEVPSIAAEQQNRNDLGAGQKHQDTLELHGDKRGYSPQQTIQNEIT